MGDAASPAKKAPKKTAKPAEHPKYLEMVSTAIGEMKERRGSSRQAIVKYVKANFKVADNYEVHVKAALKRGVTGGQINQVKGTGASGSFKLLAKQKPPKKTPTTPTAKKPAAKKTAAKKTSASAKKPTKKPAAKKPAKKKAAKSKTTPNKKAVKKPVAKKPAAKKATKTKSKKKGAAKGKGKGKGN